MPVPFEDLPVRLPEDLQVTGAGNPLEGRADFIECVCPSLRRRGAARDGHDRLPRRRDVDVDADLRALRRAPAAHVRPRGIQALAAGPQIVWGADAGGYMFDQRLIGKVLQDLGELPQVPGREPFTNALMHQMIRLEGRKMSKHLGNVVDPNELVVHVGADTVRLAVLHAASPGRIFNWNEQPVRYCQIFLKKLYGYAQPRLAGWVAGSQSLRAGDGAEGEGAGGDEGTPEGGRRREPEIDASERLRRKLANWCRVALEKVGIDYERLEMQRVAHNAMLLLTRIQDFEQRAVERRGELEEADREAIVAALLQLVQMLAPLTPHIAEELWSAAGRETLVSLESWPEAEDTAPPPDDAASQPEGAGSVVDGSAGGVEM